MKNYFSILLVLFALTTKGQNKFDLIDKKWNFIKCSETTCKVLDIYKPIRQIEFTKNYIIFKCDNKETHTFEIDYNMPSTGYLQLSTRKGNKNFMYHLDVNKEELFLEDKQTHILFLFKKTF